MGNEKADNSVATFFGTEAKDEEKALRWRFLAKGATLEDISKVLGVRAEEGDKQTSFRVNGTGETKEQDLELGDVVRHLFSKWAEAGVTLKDLIALVPQDEAKGADEKDAA